MTLRAARRAVALAAALLFCRLRYAMIRIRGPLTLVQRALWMQSTGRLVTASLGIQVTVEGTPPTSGVVVANHLSYLDVAVLSAVMPCFFIAKVEIERWPFFGGAARSGGTIFIDRSSLASAEHVCTIITERLSQPVPTLFFPEGTSTDGTSMLRFHSRLFEPIIVAGAPITAAAVRYVSVDGSPESELCWFGDAPFLPHLLRNLGAAAFTAHIRFGQPRVYPHRRVAADETYDEISAMRDATQAELAPV
ncbi:MAG TPA: lysophospholipid acyltransferase family protein [Terracidiphilus sp.]|jgi:1-acyl-sn-glycerol-3-phosphate acyltransferase|nr:lysophospholipid acyltransferase family protein [Terracidiphilus sp.]